MSKLEEFRIKLASKIEVINTLPSTLVNSDNSPRNIKVILNGDVFGRFLLNDYNISYSKLWINDIDGTAAFDVTLVSKTDASVRRVFSNIQFIGLKHFEITDSLTSSNFSFKSGFENTTVSELKSQLDSLRTNAEKVKKMNSYFNITIPDDVSLADIIGFTEKASDPTVAILRYRLSKGGIANGSNSNRNATGLVKSEIKEVEILNFNSTKETQMYLDSITSISPKSGHMINNKIPTQVNQSDLDSDGVYAKVGENSLVLPSEFKIIFTIPEGADDVRNIHNASMNILVTITKNNNSKTAVSKIFKLSDLKYYHELLHMNDVSVTRNTAIANVYAFNTWKIMDAEFQEKYFKTAVTISGFAEWEKYYDVKYEYDYINEVEGTIGVNLVLINKENPSKRKTFSKEVTGFIKYRLPEIKLEPSDFVIKKGSIVSPAQLRNYTKISSDQLQRWEYLSMFFDVKRLSDGVVLTQIRVNKYYYSHGNFDFAVRYEFVRRNTRVETKDNKRARMDLQSNNRSHDGISYFVGLEVNWVKASAADNDATKELYSKWGYWDY